MTQDSLSTIINTLRSFPHESEVVEFKEAKTSFDFTKLGKYFSALCNEANLKKKSEAWLIFGIADNGEIVGTNYRSSKKELEKLKGEIAKKINQWDYFY